MSKIKIVIEGHAKQIKDGWLASSTATLVRTAGKNILIDPGCNREKLLGAMEKEKLKVDNIDFVLLTHNHLDHTLLAGIFPNARILTTEEIYKNDNQVLHNNKIPETDLEIIQTSGHCNEHCSLVVPMEKDTYVVAGDVFWYVDGEEQKMDINKPDEVHPAEVNMEKLVASRRKILKIADWVIPGHGKMFKVKK